MIEKVNENLECQSKMQALAWGLVLTSSIVIQSCSCSQAVINIDQRYAQRINYVIIYCSTFQFICINMTHLIDYKAIKMIYYDTRHGQSPAKPRIACDLTNPNCWHISCKIMNIIFIYQTRSRFVIKIL